MRSIPARTADADAPLSLSPSQIAGDAGVGDPPAIKSNCRSRRPMIRRAWTTDTAIRYPCGRGVLMQNALAVHAAPALA